MRKASHEGGDSTSITSGVENEMKKKPKKTSIKRKVPSFQESDDTVNEPLLQRDKDKSEAQSTKYIGKGKTESIHNKDSDNRQTAITTPVTKGFCGTTESLLSFKETEKTKTTSSMVTPLHNYMNTNVFNTHENAKPNVTSKSQILVEIDSNQQTGYSPSPLIFTTAKIHTDAKTKQMEPVHVTPIPILSTIEVSVTRGGSLTTNGKKIGNGSSVISSVYTPVPLDQIKEEKSAVSNFNTVFPSTSTKDIFAKPIIVTSASKLANNNSTIQISSISTILPSTTAAKTLSMITNTNDKQEDSKNNSKEQELPQNAQSQIKLFNLDNTRNNVTVQTTTLSTNKGIDIPTKSAKTSKGDESQIQKPVESLDMNISYESQHKANNIKSPSSSKNLEEITNAKTKNSIDSIQQIQRQKTVTEEISDIEPNSKASVEPLKEFSTKMPSLSRPKMTDATNRANDTQNMNEKSATDNPASLISKTSNISTIIKPIVTNMTPSMTSSDISCKPATMNTFTKSVSPITTSVKVLTNANKTHTAPIVISNSTATTQSSAANKTKASAKSTSISKPKSPDMATVQLQTSTGKFLTEKAPVGISSAKTTTPMSSVKSETASSAGKQSSAVTTTVTTTQHLANSTSKIAIAKTPSATSATTLANSTSIVSNPTSSSSQVLSPAPPSILKASSAGNSVTLASQIISSVQNSANNQCISSVGAINTTKTISAVPSGKPPVASSSSGPIATGIKSPSNNSAQTCGASKPSTASIPKVASKTSSGSVSTPTAAKPSQSTSPTTISTKESVTSAKRPLLNKTQSMTTKNPPLSSANKSVAGSTAKPLLEASTNTVSATKKPGMTVLPKTSSVTSLTKAPAVSTSTKTIGVSSANNSLTSKSTTANASQVSANKSISIAGSSAPSSSLVQRPSESLKKGGSKSSDNNQDGKVSKA